VPKPVISNPNPFSLTFPYPQIGEIIRPPGDGCSTCVHGTYCPVLYWFRRGAESKGFAEQPIDDIYLGRACDSWSDNPADKSTVVTQSDIDENEYIYNQGIGSEANRNGITSWITAGDR